MGLPEDAGGWISGGPSALVMREHLAPVEGANEPFFPPTYARKQVDKAAKKRGANEPFSPPTYAGTGSDGSSYCIDTLSDGTRICLVDSVGSQANRMEPVFMRPPYDSLVPQITITAGKQKRNLCEVGHRAGDALLRHSDVYPRVSQAFSTLKSQSDARELARVAPTSLVFGVWDSRKSQVKAPRIVSSVIRAYDVEELTRSAQYFPPVDYREEDLLGDNPSENDKRSKVGFNEAPATNQPGGVIAKSGIRRDVVVNLVALRRLHGGDETDALRKYILGLSLVAATSASDLYLRQGCVLSRDPEKPEPSWEAVHSDGKRESIELAKSAVDEFAAAAAAEFGVGENEDAGFNVDSAKNEMEEFKKGKPQKKK